MSRNFICKIEKQANKSGQKYFLFRLALHLQHSGRLFTSGITFIMGYFCYMQYILHKQIRFHESAVNQLQYYM